MDTQERAGTRISEATGPTIGHYAQSSVPGVLEGSLEIRMAGEPQVHGELGKTEAALEELGMVVEQLEGRLRCVTRNDDLPSNLLTEVQQDALVTVAERIRGGRNSIHAIHSRLVSLVARLEV